MSNPSISVITPSIRLPGLALVQKSLSRQSFRDFEWLICSPEDPQISDAHWLVDDFKGGFWTLNRAYNKLFKSAKGDVIVSWQDWVYAAPDALQKFVDAIKETSGALVSGVGDQYERLNQFGKPEVKIWLDPRKNLNNGSFYECFPNDCEWNFAAFPKEWIYKIGGMDEELDQLGYGGDQFQVGERLDMLGARFFLDQTNESYTLRHGRDDFGGQENWDKNHVLFNGKYEERKQQLISEGKWPVLKYLSC